LAEKSTKKTILVPIDFSNCSEAALLKACEFSVCMKVPLAILHVVHDPAEMPGYYSKMAKKKQLIRMEDRAREMLDDFITTVIKNHSEAKLLKKMKTILVIGIPATRILQVAEKINAAMIVMGSRGMTGLKHIMLGSVAEQVVRFSPIPVTVVKVAKIERGKE